VIPYYEPLIPAQKRGRHLYWSNFKLPKVLSNRDKTIMGGKDEVRQWCVFHDYDFYSYKGNQRIDKIARNLVDYEAGLAIFNTARGIIDRSKDKQISMFEDTNGSH
jgi:DNA (cytosine-5)-methyltransferase 1